MLRRCRSPPSPEWNPFSLSGLVEVLPWLSLFGIHFLAFWSFALQQNCDVNTPALVTFKYGAVGAPNINEWRNACFVRGSPFLKGFRSSLSKKSSLWCQIWLFSHFYVNFLWVFVKMAHKRPSEWAVCSQSARILIWMVKITPCPNQRSNFRRIKSDVCESSPHVLPNLILPFLNVKIEY